MLCEYSKRHCEELIPSILALTQNGWNHVRKQKSFKNLGLVY